jgi:hypothetical protein
MAKIRFKLRYFLSLLVPFFGSAVSTQASDSDVVDEPKAAGSEEAAAEAASGGSLSAGAIAAAVAAAAAIAAVADSGSGGDAAPAPAPAPTPAPTPSPTIMVNAVVTEQQEVTKTVIVPVTTETTTKSAVNTTTESAVQTEVTVLSKVNTTSRSTSSTVTLTQATVSGQAYDATLAENIANKTENDGIAETGEFYYVEIPTQVDSGVVDFVEVTIMTDGVDLIDVEYEVEQVVDITVDAAVETTNIEDVGVAVSQTAPAP